MIDHAGISTYFDTETGGQKTKSLPHPFLPVIVVFLGIRIVPEKPPGTHNSTVAMVSSIFSWWCNEISGYGHLMPPFSAL
jgi:hypothetical protein